MEKKTDIINTDSQNVDVNNKSDNRKPQKEFNWGLCVFVGICVLTAVILIAAL